MEIQVHAPSQVHIVGSPAAINECVEIGMDEEWQKDFYEFPEADAVLLHWAYNALVNNVTDLKDIDGWANIHRGSVTFHVTSHTDDYEIED